MQCYTLELDNQSKYLCTIATLFGKFKYNRLTMGLKCSPDYAWEVMENTFHDVEDADVYIDGFVLPPIPGMTKWHYCAPY
jgi:hypothetical protein